MGVDGLQCEECKPLHYGFSPTGCSPCDCDPTGSLNMQCDLLTGKCDCYEKVGQFSMKTLNRSLYKLKTGYHGFCINHFTSF